MQRSDKRLALRVIQFCNDITSIIPALQKLLFQLTIFGLSLYGLVHFLFGGRSRK
jgi:hypothetical protein